jgi:hypothetical protein
MSHRQLLSLADFNTEVTRLQKSNKEHEEEVTRKKREREREIRQITQNNLTIVELEELHKQEQGRTKERYAAIEKLYEEIESSKETLARIQEALDMATAANKASKDSGEK